jgi:hypothetical protein
VTLFSWLITEKVASKEVTLSAGPDDEDAADDDDDDEDDVVLLPHAAASPATASTAPQHVARLNLLLKPILDTSAP